MSALLPLLLLGGVAAWGWHTPTPTTAAPEPTVEPTTGLGGYVQGVHAELLRQLPQAHRGFLAALAADPDNLSLRQHSLSLALATNDFDTATRLAKTLKQAEQPPMAQLALLVEAVNQHDAAEAARILKNLQQLGPILPIMEVLHTQQEATTHPVGPLLPKLAKYGWVGQWHAARLALQAGEEKAAEVLIRQALKTNPGAYPIAQLALATLPAAQHPAILAAFAEANPTLASALTQAPAPMVWGTPAAEQKANLAAALQGFALELWAEGAPGAALQLSALAQRAGPDTQLGPFLPYAHALIMEAAGDKTGAQNAYTALLPDAHFGPLAQVRLNELTYSMATTPKAQRAIANRAWKLAQQNPKGIVFWQSAAELAMAQADYTRTAQAVTALFPLIPQNPSATYALRQAELYFTRGAALAQAGKGPEAEADLNAAIALNPAHAEALNYLGYMWVDENRNLDAAFRMLKKAHLLAPQNASITDSVGWAYFRKGDYETARAYLEQALALNAELPEILSHLADTYAKLGNTQEAAKLWRRALKLAEEGAEVPNAAFTQTLRTKVNALP